MNIQKLWLKDFRNFTNDLIEFSDGVSVIVGNNATGKTNILEAISLLATGKSFKARLTEEMINSGKEVARVKGLFTNQDGEKLKLEVVLTGGEITFGRNPKQVERSPRKKLLVNGVSKRLFNFSGNYKVVLFGPWDMDLVTESPSLRRKFLDNVLSLVDREYFRSHLSYEKGLRQRNKLLLRIREEGGSRSQLMFWDRLLIKNGEYLTRRRAEFVEFVNRSEELDGHKFSLEYDRSVISEPRLNQYKNEEVAAATTLVGPHRDDFCFLATSHSNSLMKNRDLARFGSRGEQRMGVLWLKLAELSFIEQETKEKPTLLLDDIFSELDTVHRKIVINIVKNQQTIITTADKGYMKGTDGLKKLDVISLKD